MWRGILVHHTAAPDGERLDTESIRRWHTEGRGWSDIGYHAVVERVGSVYVPVMCRPLYRRGAHAGTAANGTHIGVAFAGNFMEHEPQHEQVLAGARLIASLCWAFDIDPDEIIGHRTVKATACPGDRFPIDELRSMVIGLLP